MGRVYKMHEEHLGVLIWVLSFFFFFPIYFLATQHMGILVPQPGIKPVPLQWKTRVLTTGTG